MAEIHVIARSVTRAGKADQLRALLQGILAPTRTEKGCKRHELYQSDSTGRFYFDEIWESRQSPINTWQPPHFKHLEQALGDLLE